jgi:hypothetical protein
MRQDKTHLDIIGRPCITKPNRTCSSARAPALQVQSLIKNPINSKKKKKKKKKVTSFWEDAPTNEAKLTGDS